MGSRVLNIDDGVGISFVASAAIHVAVFLLLVWWGRLFPVRTVLQETYYVDVVTLPVANPQSGRPTPKTGEAGAVPSPAPVTSTPSQMTLPVNAKSPVKTPVQPAKQAKSVESDAAFADRMAKLEKNIEARREEAVLEKLRSKVKSGALNSGMPRATGTETGSSYADFVKSRLEDALKITSSYTTKNPEVSVRLKIGTDGRLLLMKIEHSSGDASFELAVRRAIDLASAKFTAPPNHKVFENGFIFKPKSISDGTLR